MMLLSIFTASLLIFYLSSQHWPSDRMQERILDNVVNNKEKYIAQKSDFSRTKTNRSR